MQTIGRFSLFILIIFSSHLVAQEQQQTTEEQLAYVAWAENLWGSIERQTGNIALVNGVAELMVPENFYYVNAGDSKKILEEIWGNPPGTADTLLGMLFPAGTTPFEGSSWGVTIEYEQDGYVSDEDADQMDYAELLTQMQQDTTASSAERVKQGYEPIDLVGWAATPYYDKATKKLHWAKEIRFGSNEINTLNYNIRVLGRKGVLVLNFIAGMDQLDTINSNLDTVLAIADFKDGSRYYDFDPDIDDVAAYGIGALVAGKVLLKTGLIATALLFLKKFGIYLIVVLAGLAGKFFKRKKKQE